MPPNFDQGTTDRLWRQYYPFLVRTITGGLFGQHFLERGSRSLISGLETFEYRLRVVLRQTFNERRFSFGERPKKPTLATGIGAKMGECVGKFVREYDDGQVFDRASKPLGNKSDHSPIEFDARLPAEVISARTSESTFNTRFEGSCQ